MEYRGIRIDEMLGRYVVECRIFDTIDEAKQHIDNWLDIPNFSHWND